MRRRLLLVVPRQRKGWKSKKPTYETPQFCVSFINLMGRKVQLKTSGAMIPTYPTNSLAGKALKTTIGLHQVWPPPNMSPVEKSTHFPTAVYLSLLMGASSTWIKESKVLLGHVWGDGHRQAGCGWMILSCFFFWTPLNSKTLEARRHRRRLWHGSFPTFFYILEFDWSLICLFDVWKQKVNFPLSPLLWGNDYHITLQTNGR